MVADVRIIVPNDNVVLPVPPQEVQAGNGRSDLPRRIHPPVSLPAELLLIQHVWLRSFHGRRVNAYRVQVKHRKRAELLKVVRIRLLRNRRQSVIDNLHRDMRGLTMGMSATTAHR